MSTPNTRKSLSDIFDVALQDTDKSLAELKIEAKIDHINSLEKQREYVKGKIVSLIEKGDKALDDMIKIAETTEDKNDYKVVAQMIDTLVATNISLLDVEVVHKVKESETEDSKVVTNNNVFVGSTADFQKTFLRNNES